MWNANQSGSVDFGETLPEFEKKFYAKFKLFTRDFLEWPQDILDVCLWCNSFRGNRARCRPIPKSLLQDIAEGLYTSASPPKQRFEILGGVRIWSWVCAQKSEEETGECDPVNCEDFTPLVDACRIQMLERLRPRRD